MSTIENELPKIRREVSIGYETIRIFRPEGIDSMQAGYSRSPDGKSLVGSGAGDWLAEWTVIGYEEMCGDPIFVDTSAAGFPVFTAIHGEGRWDAKRIAVSLKAFGEALAALAVLARGREHPSSLESNPIAESEKREFLGAVARINPGVDAEFWELLLCS